MDGLADGLEDGLADGLEDGLADGLEDGSVDGLADGLVNEDEKHEPQRNELYCQTVDPTHLQMSGIK